MAQRISAWPGVCSQISRLVRIDGQMKQLLSSPIRVERVAPFGRADRARPILRCPAIRIVVALDVDGVTPVGRLFTAAPRKTTTCPAARE